MSVASDFWAGEEPRGSSALRLAQSFRRTSLVSTSASTSQEEVSRKNSLGSIEAVRKPSFTALSLRLMRSRSKTLEEIEENDCAGARLGDLFFALPSEIQVHIFCQLEAQDILNLRLTSQAVSAMLDANAATISRSVLQKTIRGDATLYLETLYPPPRPLRNIDYFVQMLHRNAVVEKMVLTITDFVQVKIYLVKSLSRQKQFAKCRRRLLDRLKTPAFIIYHFLEMMRVRLTEEPEINWPAQVHQFDICSACDHFQCKIVEVYPDDLLPTYQFYKIMISAFRQKLRPPTYAGSIERRLRGWHRNPATDDEVVKVLIAGGMREVVRIMQGPKFIPRLEMLRAFTARADGASMIEDSRIISSFRRTPAMKALDMPEGVRMARLSSVLPPLREIWIHAARSKILKAAIVAGTIKDEWQIPDAFTFIQDIMADRETRLGESDEFDPNVDFDQLASQPDDEVDESAVNPVII